MTANNERTKTMNHIEFSNTNWSVIRTAAGVWEFCIEASDFGSRIDPWEKPLNYMLDGTELRDREGEITAWQLRGTRDGQPYRLIIVND